MEKQYKKFRLHDVFLKYLVSQKVKKRYQDPHILIILKRKHCVVSGLCLASMQVSLCQRRRWGAGRFQQ